MSKFTNGNTLYTTVKEKLTNDKEESQFTENSKLYGPAGGYTNGRLFDL